ncbi:hypothetical protein D9757_003529 [Collybiopsis confluens]|uniref:protein-serine/threonine phosphatase n=1 Tax=Collybiopsis confluens TaxID=2823264 RepID=A0A8H5MD16_9AGAR|nr:hypothetical protein D9757_003529 [Collybiopsis confluens]
MGQTLSVPATSKKTESGGNERVAYSVTEMQGWRITMEDAHASLLDLDEEKNDHTAFFAVYDGHGGGTVAKYAGEHVHKRLITEESYSAKQYDTALKKAFMGTDEDILADPARSRDPSGCTAVAALITDDKIYVANAGDSRSVLSVQGEVKPLSFDHKPTNESEKRRITGAGGYVEYGRVNGNLALSRAIGDFEFKKNRSLPPEKQVITSDPEITVHEIDQEDEFLVLACDGIWDCLNSQQVVDFIRWKVAEGKELGEIGEDMCDHCIAPDTSGGAGIGCDNMTILIIALLHGRTKEEWQAWVKDRVDKQYGYPTPSNLPVLYSQSRLVSFKSRMEVYEARERERQSGNFEESFLSPGLSAFARVLGSTGGISFSPESGILSGADSLMFGGDDSDDEESGEESTSSFFTETLGLGSARNEEDTLDATQSLKDKLAEFEKDVQEDGVHVEDDQSSSNPALQGEAPPPPEHEANGAPVTPVPQLKSEPGGDKPSPAVEAEGLMDPSEEPLKV